MRIGLIAVTSVWAIACRPPSDTAVVHRRLLQLSEVDSTEEGRLAGAVAQSQAAPEVRDIAVHGDRRPSLVVSSPARVIFRAEPIREPELRFALAVRPPNAPLTSTLIVNGEVVSEESWVEERDWVDRRLALDRFSGERMELELVLDREGAQVMLAHPVLLGRSGSERPNVIVYVVDCLRADHVGAYGYERPTTPEIDALARDSVVLEELNACAPWTKPSTACLFTSLLPIYHQARTVDDALAEKHVTIAESFRAAGYLTAAWVANPVIDPRVFSFNQGFDRWVDLRSFEERAGRSHIHDLEADAAEITKGVLPWLEANREVTFFLYLHSIDLHFGYERRPPFDKIFVSEDSRGLDRDRELYDNELAYNDRELGKLVARLKELGLYDKTILLVTSDHGEEFGEHGSTRHGKTLYQPALHIPGILKLPHSRASGRRVAALASNVDLAPTLLELTGIEPPRAFQGRSLVPVFEKDVDLPERPVFAELVAPRVVSYAVRDERFKYIRDLIPEPSELLFDLREDPAEEANLFAEPPAVARRLLTLLERFVRLGQHGLHVSLPGERRTASSVHLEVRGEAEIMDSFRFGIVTGDVFELSADGRRIALSMAPGKTTRHLVVQTRPEDATLHLEFLREGELVLSRNLEPRKLEVSVSEAERFLRE